MISKKENNNNKVDKEKNGPSENKNEHMDQKDTSHHWGLPLNDKNDTSGIVNTDHMHNVVSIFHDANSINLELFYCESTLF